MRRNDDLICSDKVCNVIHEGKHITVRHGCETVEDVFWSDNESKRDPESDRDNEMVLYKWYTHRDPGTEIICKCVYPIKIYA